MERWCTWIRSRHRVRGGRRWRGRASRCADGLARQWSWGWTSPHPGYGPSSAQANPCPPNQLLPNGRSVNRVPVRARHHSELVKRHLANRSLALRGSARSGRMRCGMWPVAGPVNRMGVDGHPVRRVLVRRCRRGDLVKCHLANRLLALRGSARSGRMRCGMWPVAGPANRMRVNGHPVSAALVSCRRVRRVPVSFRRARWLLVSRRRVRWVLVIRRPVRRGLVRRPPARRTLVDCRGCR
ncbi:hypothetical protein SAMN04244553_6682 [Nocardia amikacinitolerans]|uniref:Uncharacterized protein n=1 Tax=Nocardia amikacinitolerans TaxID=756689 RepID=A0A285LYY0_9NOCA|nr:hypothetical protein SAMN04244553_6682 [Nocardia amikacinitolerans]